MTDEQKRCPFSYYDRTAYCNICEVTGEACDGYVVTCEPYRSVKGPYGDED